MFIGKSKKYQEYFCKYTKKIAKGAMFYFFLLST